MFTTVDHSPPGAGPSDGTKRELRLPRVGRVAPSPGHVPAVGGGAEEEEVGVKEPPDFVSIDPVSCGVSSRRSAALCTLQTRDTLCAEITGLRSAGYVVLMLIRRDSAALPRFGINLNSVGRGRSDWSTF